MPTVVSDNFNRANSGTLGTATTGQVWTQVSGSLGIDTNQALFTWLAASSPSTTRAVIETGLLNSITSVVLPSVDVPNFAAGIGIICRYVDVNNYFRLITFDFPGAHGVLRLQRVFAGSVSTVQDFLGVFETADGDTIGIACCGPLFDVLVNGVSVGTYDDTAEPQNYGTKSGLIGISGTTFFDFSNRYDDFLVVTNDTCPTSPSPSASPSESLSASPSATASSSPSASPENNECVTDNTKESVYIVDPETGLPLVAAASLDGLYMIIAHQIFTYPFVRKGFQRTPYLREPYVLDAQSYALGLSLLTKAERGQIIKAEMSGSPESGGQGKIT